MVHVLELLGCTANGPTTEAALQATPAAISAYLRFLQRHGEKVEPDAAFTTAIEEHVTEGIWLGNGSPYVTYGPDLEPVSEAELKVFLGRLHGLTEELAAWAERQSDAQLEASPEAGRTARAIFLHALSSTGAYLSPALGTVSGFSKLLTAAE